MSDHPPPTPPPAGEDGAGTDQFPYLPPARVQSMRRLVNLAHGQPADVGEVKPDYGIQLDAHRVLLGYLKANADAEALELKRRAVEVQERDSARKADEQALKLRAVEVQEEQLAVRRADHELARERFEDSRRKGGAVKSLPEVAAEAARRARERKRERDG